jgi:hypothetical protein
LIDRDLEEIAEILGLSEEYRAMLRDQEAAKDLMLLQSTPPPKDPPSKPTPPPKTVHVRFRRNYVPRIIKKNHSVHWQQFYKAYVEQ